MSEEQKMALQQWSDVALCVLAQEAQRHPDWTSPRVWSEIAQAAQDDAGREGQDYVYDRHVRTAVHLYEQYAAEKDQKAWDEDEADMTRIAREWEDFDRDPPGS